MKSPWIKKIANIYFFLFHLQKMLREDKKKKKPLAVLLLSQIHVEKDKTQPLPPSKHGLH